MERKICGAELASDNPEGVAVVSKGLLRGTLTDVTRFPPAATDLSASKRSERRTTLELFPAIPPEELTSTNGADIGLRLGKESESVIVAGTGTSNVGWRVAIVLEAEFRFPWLVSSQAEDDPELAMFCWFSNIGNENVTGVLIRE